MTMHKDEKGLDAGFRFPLGNTRRDFLKFCGTATAGGMAGLLLTGAAQAEDPPESLRNSFLQDPHDELFWAGVRRQFVLKPGQFRYQASL